MHFISNVLENIIVVQFKLYLNKICTMKKIQCLFLLAFLFANIGVVSSQDYRYYFFDGDDSEQLNPIWGWNLPIEYDFRLDRTKLKHRYEKNKLLFSSFITPSLSYENIYMNDQLTIQMDSTGVASYQTDDNPDRTYEKKFLSYQSKHRFVNIGAMLKGEVYFNSISIGVGIKPTYMIGGNVKLRYTEGDERQKTTIRYKDNDYFNLNRFQMLGVVTLQVSYLKLNFGRELMPMFQENLGPSIFKNYVSFDFAMPLSRSAKKKGFDWMDKDNDSEDEDEKMKDI